MKKILKKIAVAMLGIAIVVGTTTLSEQKAYANDIKIIVDGNVVEFDEPPLNDNGSLFVPIRAILEKADNYMTREESLTTKADDEKRVILDWKAEQRVVGFVNGYNDYFAHYVEINVDDGSVLNRIRWFIDGVELEEFRYTDTLDLMPKLINGRTLLPLRAVAEMYGYDVEWDGTTRTVYIDTSNPIVVNEKGEKIDIYKVISNVTTITTEEQPSIEIMVDNMDNHIRIATNKLTEQERIDLANEMLGYVNELRAEHGVAPLELDQDLIDFAYIKAKDYELGGYSSDAVASDGLGTGNHVSPRYGSPTQYYNYIYGTNYSFISENYTKIMVAMGSEASSSFNTWVNSEGHKNAMLSTKRTKLGFGFYTIEDENHEDYNRTILLLEMR